MRLNHGITHTHLGRGWLIRLTLHQRSITLYAKLFSGTTKCQKDIVSENEPVWIACPCQHIGHCSWVRSKSTSFASRPEIDTTVPHIILWIFYLLSNGMICKWSNLNNHEYFLRKHEKYEKMVEHLKGCMYNIIHMSAANYSRLPKLVPNASWVIVLYNTINIKENIKKGRKIAEKIKWVFLQNYLYLIC